MVRAFDVLATMREAGVPLSALQAARATGLDRTVVHRLLRTLVAVGVAVEDRGRFALGPETVRLGNAFLDTLPARRVALPYLVEVQTGTIRERPWTVTLSVAIGDVTTVVERIWNPAAPLTTVLEVGDTFAADLGAAGRSMLAFLSADEVQRVLGADRYAAVADTLEEVRAAGGVALTRGEARAGIEAVAAAITSRTGRPAAAIAVAGVDLGDELAYDSPLARHLRRAAQAVGRGMPD